MPQASARTASQATHAAPPVPHFSTVVAVTQVAPSQQPWGQVPALHELHVPLLHFAVPAQAWQIAPPVPQAASVVPGRQVVPEQQPAHD